jgi:putative oxidoreductase
MPRSRDLSLLAARVVLGGYLAAHGAQKLFGSFDGHGIEATSAAFDSLGLKPGGFFARLAGASELGGGALVALGAADPVGPVALAGAMAVASATHLPNGPFAAKGGYELALTNTATALALLASGPGRLSVDRLTGVHLRPSLRRVIVAGAVASSAISLALLLQARRRTIATPLVLRQNSESSEPHLSGESSGSSTPHASGSFNGSPTPSEPLTPASASCEDPESFEPEDD